MSAVDMASLVDIATTHHALIERRGGIWVVTVDGHGAFYAEVLR